MVPVHVKLGVRSVFLSYLVSLCPWDSLWAVTDGLWVGGSPAVGAGPHTALRVGRALKRGEGCLKQAQVRAIASASHLGSACGFWN